MFKSITKRLNSHQHNHSQLFSRASALSRSKKGVFFIPDITMKSSVHLYSPTTAFNTQRGSLRLAQQYQEEINQMADAQKAMLPLSFIYDHYQDLYTAEEQNKLREELEHFYTNAIPEIRTIDKVRNTLQLFEKAYENYQKEPGCFQSYYYLSLVMNDLLNETITQRTITAYVRSFIANHPSECFKLSQITFNNNRRSAVAHYNPNSQTINISDYFFSESPSEQAFTLLHELKHTTQRPCFIDDVIGMERDEREAEAFAASHIKCRLCLRMMQLARQIFPITLPGYLQSYDFYRYLDRTDVPCKAHCGCNSDPLLKAIKDGNIYAARAIDSSNGTILDRLPALPTTSE